MNELDLLFDDLEEEVAPKGFEVKDLTSANWCGAKIKMATEKIAEATEMKKKAIEHVNRWYEEYCKGYENTIGIMESFLKPYVKKHIADEKAKSIKLLNIKAGYRTGRNSVVIDDMDAAVKCAKRAGVKTKIEETVSKTDLEKLRKEKGLLCEGVSYIPATESFYVKVEE